MSQFAPHETPIAVVGLGCRMPGADNLTEYWKLINEGRSGIVELGPEKIDLSLYYHPERGQFGRSYSKIGGVVPERPLDPAICQLPADLEANTDPAHLIMCEVAAMALRHAGYDPFNVPHRNTGVYVGHSGGSVLSGEMAFGTYSEQVTQFVREDKTFRKLPAPLQEEILRNVVARIHREKPTRRADGGPELGACMVSAAVAQAFGLTGPALATDAACASSLIAMAMGIHALRNGLIDMAIVGGASCSKWYALVLFSQAQSISGTGSRPFDANADGLISSDGYAAVVLKTLPRAIADGDPIQAVIRGIGVSSDGRGKSLWAPRKEGQILAVQRAYGKDVDPSWLQYIECHATSTQVGDSTELAALTMALKPRLPQGMKLPIGSVKANIGHTLESAGIAGFVKAVMAMQNRVIPGQINFNTPNPDVDWNNIPFQVQKQSAPWPEPAAGRPRRCAVNAFGIGGLNVHVVMDDQPTESLKTQIRNLGIPGSVPRVKMEPEDRAIAIVGASALLPGALTLNAFWDLLVSGRDPKTEAPATRWNPAIYHVPGTRANRRSRNKTGGYVTDFVYDWKKHKVAPKQIANANPLQFMLLDAADQALRDAGYDKRDFDHQRTAAVVGSVFGGDFACDLQMGLRIPEYQAYLRKELQERGVPAGDLDQIVAGYQDLLLKHMPAMLDETGSFTASTLASRLTKTFDLMGGAFSIDAGDTSSMAAISSAIGMLLDQSVDMVLCASGQRSMDLNVFEGFQLRDALASGKTHPAFSQSMDGVVPGEGASVVLLKRLSDARRDGNQIRGIIRSLGVSLDVQNYARAYREATERALETAGLSPAAIGLVETASVGLKSIDEAEATVLSETLNTGDRQSPAIVASVTGQIGHTLGLAGMAAMMKAVVEMEHGQVPMTPGLTDPIAPVVQHPETIRVAQTAQTVFATLPDARTVAAVTNSGPNGAVYTLLIEGGQGLPTAPAKKSVPATSVSTPAVSADWKTIRLAAPSRDGLIREVAKWKADTSALFSTGGIDHFNGRDDVRLAIVAENPQNLSKKLQLAADQLEKAAPLSVLEQQGVFYREVTANRPKLAFVFPGQGSQYTGMLHDLVAESKTAREIMNELDASLVKAGLPKFAELAWTPNEQLGQDVFLTQLAMLVGDTLMARVLFAEGLRPDVITSHSYGEFPALVAAGAFTFEEAIRITRERTNAVEGRESTRGSLLSTTAGLEVVERLLKQASGAYLASHNAPDQCVIGGTAEAIQGMKRLLDAEGFATRVLAVPRPYHTPLLREAQPAFQSALARATIQAPQGRFLSSVSLDYVTSADAVRKNLVAQLTDPVRYVQLIQKLAADGATIVLEVGPQQVLTRLNQRILKDRPVSLISADLPKHTGREALERLRGLLETAGLWPAPKLEPTVSLAPGQVLFFDATQRRRGVQVPATTTVSLTAATPVRTTTTAVAATTTTSVAVLDAPATPTVALDRAAVQAFMINYVVDQTGYPAEMVEMTADLEADLGIDSIKKAQLIGELAENFTLTHLADSLQDLSLDDFRTLDSILDFVVKPAAVVVEAAKTQASVVAEPVQSAPVVEAAATTAVALDRGAVQAFMINYVVDQTGYPAEMVEMTADLEADLGIDSIKKAQLIGELAENFTLTHLADSLQDLSLDDFRTLDSILDFVVKPAVVVVDAAKTQVSVVAEPVQSAPVVEATTTAVALDRGAVQAFMINYVVDQTGYPAEMVEMTADLEADLGIDSIKKAQLIGELAENFTLTHLADSLQDLSLDDFRTLDSILDFVVKPAVVVVDAAKTQASVEAEPVQSAPVVESAATAAVALDRGAVQAFMINYVVDQTGYPAEMVEMTADLEADLGIDSIKKAQLIGELAENFTLTHLADSLQDLSLDDFRTLDSILDFVVKPAAVVVNAAKTQASVEAEPVQSAPVVDPTPVVETIPAVAAEPVPVVDTTVEQLPDAFCVVPIRGTPYEMGLRHGNSQSAEIRAIMERYAAMLGPRLQNIPELDEALAKPTMYFGEQELEELHGIADGAKLPVPAVIAHNLGMYPDYVPGCTQFAFTRERNPGFGMVHAVNEDSPLSLSLPDCIARIVQVRRPVGGIPHVTFSVAGQTGGLNGINAAGLAISSTLLLDRPRRASTAVGKVHPVVVKRLLENAETIEDAVAILRGLERAGAWSLCLSHHHTDRLCYLEYDGGTLTVQDGPKAVLTTNHCLLQDPLAEVPEHSKHRLNRLHQLLGDGSKGGVTLDMAQQALRDQFDLGRGRQTSHATMNTIRRVDNQISIVMCPEIGELYVTPGPRSGAIINQYFRLDLKELLNHSDETEHVRPQSASTPSPTVSRPPRVVDATTHAGLPADADRVVQRHVLRMAEAPLTAGAQAPQWSGGVLILGQNKLAEALKTRFTAEGVRVTQLVNTGDTAATIAAVEAAWAQGPAPHLFITTARDDAASVASFDGWQSRRQIGVLAPFFVCQKWTQLVQQAKLTSVATLVGVTALGGDFGFGGRVHGIEGGGITGLFKGIRREMPEMLVKVIDAPFEEAPATLIEAIWKELTDRNGPLETGWIRGTRSIVRAVPQTGSSQRRGQKTPHGTWVVTGGARGVTAVVARELGRRFGLTMHLLGSTEQPTIDPSWRNLTEEGLKTLKRTISDQARTAGKNPAQTWKEVERAIEIDRTLQSFRADGVTVHYHACDVSDRAKLGATLDKVRSLSGPIHGIIHGAGVEAACRFDKKKPESVAATLSVKIDAALALLELTQVDPLEWFLGFGSTSGRFGGMGQTDYSMAQDLLCKVCDTVRARWPEVSAVGLHWPPWADVGMAARPESKIALKSSNLAFMPPLEGTAHVLDELLTEGIEGELLFLDKPDMIDTDGTMPSPALKAEYVRRDALVRASSLIDTIHELSPQGVIGTAYFDPASDPFLLEHRHQNVPILPAVGGMEAMAETARLLAADQRKVVGVKGMAVHQGLRFHTPRPQRARVVAQVTAEGTRCALQADFCDRIGRLVEAHRLQMDATIELAAEYPKLAQFDFGPTPADWTTHKYVADWRTMDYPEEARVYHGYPFQALKDYAIVDQGVWAHIVVPEPSQIAGRRPVEGWLLPSSTLDASLLACDLMLWKTLRISTLPKGFDHIRFARPLVPGETLTLRVWLKSRGERSFRADLVYVDAAGKTVVQIDGFEMIEVKTGITPTTTEPANATTAPKTPAPAPQAAAPVKATAPAKPAMPVAATGPAPAPVATKPAAPRVNGSQHAAPAPAPLPLASSNGVHRQPTVPVVAASVPVPAVETTKPTSLPSVSAQHIAELPLIDRAQWVNADELVAELQFHPTQDPFLQQHTFSKKPLLPAVIGLESMIEAAWLTNPQLQLEAVREFQVFQPFKFRDDQPQSAKVVVKREGTAWRCTLLNTNGKEVVNQSALIEFSSQPDKVLVPSLEQPPFPYSPMNYAEGDKAQLIHGPLFRCLKGLCLQRDGGWGKVTAAEANNLAGSRKGHRWFIPAATLDSCLVAAGVDLFILMNKRVEVPHRMDEVRIVRLPNPNEACVVRLIYRGHTDRHTTYDMILYGADKTPLLTVKAYQGIRTSKEADSSLWIPEAAEDRFASK